MRKLLSFILLCASMTMALTTFDPVKVSSPAEVDGYEYGAATVYYNGVFYRFYCSLGRGIDTYHVISHPDRESLDESHDYIRMRTSRNGSVWSASRIVLTPTVGNKEECACDPAIIQGYDGYWYLYYTGHNSDQHTVTYVARSENIEGPYKRYYREYGYKQWFDGWEEYPEFPEYPYNLNYYVPERNPEPILTPELPFVTGDAYGAGQLSVVKKDGKYHFWFTDVSEASAFPKRGETDWKFVHIVSDSPYEDLDGENRDVISLGERNKWGKYEYKNKFERNDFGDVKWDPVNNQFEMWITSGHFDLYDEVVIRRYVSKDGIRWDRQEKDDKGPYPFANNVGMSGDENGWIVGGRTLVTFGAPDESLSLSSGDIERWKTEGSAKKQQPGRPWATYQFMVGGREYLGTYGIRGDGTGSTPANFQFPVTSSDLEFIAGDFDGDGITDIGAVDRTTSKWYVIFSMYGIKNDVIPGLFEWGWRWPGLASLDENYAIALGDYDGDGKTDRAIVHKPSKTWYIYSSARGSYEALVTANGETVWGWPQDQERRNKIGEITHVLTGDYDGDGKSDIGAVDCSMSREKGYCEWYVLSSKTGKRDNPLVPDYWVWSGMQNPPIHVVQEGDFDGDGKTDRAIVDNTMGLWYSYTSRAAGPYSALEEAYVLTDANGNAKRDSKGKVLYQWRVVWPYAFGGMDYAHKPIVGDFNGDGISDRTIFCIDDFTLRSAKIANKDNYFEGGFVLNYFSANGLRNIIGGSSEPIMSRYNGKTIVGENYQLLVGNYDGDAASDVILADRKTSKLYFYTSKYKGDYYLVPNYSLYPVKSAYGAVHKSHPSLSEPSVDEGKPQVTSPKSPKFDVQGLDLVISDMELGSDVRVFNMIGQNIVKGKADFAEKKIQLPSKGMYIVRVGSKSSVINVK